MEGVDENEWRVEGNKKKGGVVEEERGRERMGKDGEEGAMVSLKRRE